MPQSAAAAACDLPSHGLRFALWWSSGLFLLFDKIPVYMQWASWTSFLRYSWGAMMVNQYGNSSVGEYGAFWDEETGTVLTILEFYSLEGSIMGSVGACVALLATCILVFATCGAATLRSIKHVKR